MRKSLLATTALAAAGAFAVGTASASDRMSVGVGGYMEQWFGMADVSGQETKAKGGKATDIEGGAAQQSDSEFYVRGSLEADNGLTFSVKIEVEGNSNQIDGAKDEKQSTGVIDESQLTVRGSFGEVTLGAEDPAAAIMHYGNQDVGTGLNCGDVGKWIAGVGGCSTTGLGTSGWGLGDKNQISYYTPRLAGMQFGATYIPNSGQEGSSAKIENNDMDAWSVGLNYMGGMGDASVAVSFGHYQGSQATDVVMLSKGHDRHIKAYEKWQNGKFDPTKDFDELNAKGYADLAYWADGERADIAGATEKVMGDRTFSNFGLQVGFGAFGFDVAYATVDGGAYKANDAGNMKVKDTSKDLDVASAGLMYSDGPMAVSLSHMMADYGDGGEASASMLSLSYGLAPGVVSRTSLIGAEQTRGDGTTVGEGTAFVTGIRIDF